MFVRLARFDIRFRWLIVALWIAGTILAIATLPSLSSVTQSGNSQFLSSSSPSVQAGALAAPFEGANPSSTAIVVAARADRPLTSVDDAAFDRVVRASQQVRDVSLVRDEGTSADGRAREALVVTTAALGGSAATDVVNGVRATFKRDGAPPGLRLHLAGQLAQNVDFSGSTKSGSIARFSVIFIIVLLFIVFRAVLAPLITLLPAGLAVALSGPLIAEASRSGLTVAVVTQQLLIVLILGAGTDYGLFLVFRVREELARGQQPADALARALGRVGESITYSALTVVTALLTLLLASFGIYRDLGPALAIGVGVMLFAGLTLTPALLAIFGRVAFWPSEPRAGEQTTRLWGRLAERVVARPVAMIITGVVIFGGLTAGIIGYQTGGFTNAATAGSDSAAGAAVLEAHFAKASAGADNVLLRFPDSTWDNLNAIGETEQRLAADPVFKEVSGPLSPHGPFTVDELTRLHAALGPAASLSPTPSSPGTVPPREYTAYRGTSQFISPDGRMLQFYVTLRAGPVGSTAAADAIPQARAAVGAVARLVGAQAQGIIGQDASSYDIQSAANSSLARVVPVVLVLLFLLLVLLLRSVVAPWYLVITVGLSYLAAIGFAMIVFVHLGTQGGLNFVLPFLMFVFAMALGEDYNILVMSRIREEARDRAVFREALTRAIGVTGGTITSAGIILAGTFAVLGAVGGNSQAQELGFSIAFGILLDTFFVRTLLVPSIAVLLGNWNWWPSRLARGPSGDRQPAEQGDRAQAAGRQFSPTEGER
jgi:putative drug exporter of the RND superfamily